MISGLKAALGRGNWKGAMELLQLPGVSGGTKAFVAEWMSGMFGYEEVRDNGTKWDALRFPVFRTITTLDPLEALYAIDEHLVRQIFDTLVRYDAKQGCIVPHIAHHWVENDDYTEQPWCRRIIMAASTERDSRFRSEPVRTGCGMPMNITAVWKRSTIIFSAGPTWTASISGCCMRICPPCRNTAGAADMCSSVISSQSRRRPRSGGRNTAWLNSLGWIDFNQVWSSRRGSLTDRTKPNFLTGGSAFFVAGFSAAIARIVPNPLLKPLYFSSIMKSPSKYWISKELL
ncbi:hypothetical protein [Paenibacillus dendritiformis]|uniref:hypothetical protein n=1 Tax=Paenibacillus dendritiformis TaxID=130049 RepID=UPI001FF09F4B|nr:hypothetical protein [Paenibacillus dendritiformis]